MEENIVDALKKYEPVSVFVYGSRGRNDFNEDSDYEVTVIFDDNKYTERKVIHSEINLPKVRIYPYRRSEFVDETFETPFQKTIFMRELAESGRTIFGEKIVESLSKPKITTIDVIQRIRFDIGYALAAVLSNRSGDYETAKEEFSKSCLFGLRTLLVLKKGVFPIGYDSIYQLKEALNISPEHIDVIKAAYALRSTHDVNIDDHIFNNIAFLLEVERQIMQAYEKNGVQDLA